MMNALYNSDQKARSDSNDSEVDLLVRESYPLIALLLFTREHQLSVREEVRNQVLALKTELINEIKSYIDSLDEVSKYAEAQKEIVREQDMEYQRQIAAEVDNHLSALRIEWDQIFQIQEKALLEEKARLEAEKKRVEEVKAAAVEADRKAAEEAGEKSRLEAEKKRVEAAKAAAVEADDRKAAKEAVEKVAEEDSVMAAAAAAAAALVASKAAIEHSSGASTVNCEPMEFSYYGVEEALQAGILLKCEESAIKLQERRQQIFKEVAIRNEELRLGSKTDHGSKISRLTKTIAGEKGNVRTRVDGLLNTFFDSSCPQSINVAMFAEKIVEQQCLVHQNSVFARALVIVFVSSKVPLALDLVLCQLNRACIYTVPKHITYSKSVFGIKEAYHKAIGYREEKGEIESEESYVSRLRSYMRLYGALVQTKVEGVENKHGLENGWAWLGSFLKALPANLYTAVALLAFLDMAGFALYERYRDDFISLLEIIYQDFLVALKEEGQDAKLTIVITSLQSYIESHKFLEEPEGRSLQSSLLSRQFSPEYSKPSWTSLQNRRFDSGIRTY